MNMPYAAVTPGARYHHDALAFYRSRPPFAWLIDAMVVYLGWLIWKSMLAP